MSTQQNVSDNAHTPHVSVERDSFPAGDFGCDILGHAVVERGVLVEHDAAREAEVADL